MVDCSGHEPVGLEVKLMKLWWRRIEQSGVMLMTQDSFNYQLNYQYQRSDIERHDIQGWLVEKQMGLWWPGGDYIGIVRCGCFAMTIPFPGFQGKG